MRARRLFAVLLTVASTLVVGATPAQAAPAYPSSMASTGDSITRAFDSTWWGCFLTDCPQYSWSTGTSSSVNSQYRRLVALNPALTGHQYNDAKTGAKMADLDGQLKTAAGQGVQYVTVLMGANDVCTSSVGTMTPTATFQAQFQTGLADFFAADPNGLVYVSSLPNVVQLYNVLKSNSSALSSWNSFKTCQSTLPPGGTDATRLQVTAQEQADNNALQQVCAQYSNCRWDGLAGYNTQFAASNISTIDYFHPNLSGQNLIANVTWTASYWGG